MNNTLEIKKLVKEYDNFKLEDINFNIPTGSIVGLIGENGAGKTTLIKSILNIINIDEGSINIFDKDYKKYENIIKEDIGIVLDNIFFPELLKVYDIDLIMKDIYKNWDTDLFKKYLKNFNISNKLIKDLSKGMRKKVEIITALSHHPKLLILDEPTSGLDPIVRNEILDLFLEFVEDKNNTILFSTHITSDLERIADRIIFINKGKVVLDKNKDEIMEEFGVLKCNLDEFELISKDDIFMYNKNRNNYDILILNKNKLSKKYKDFVINKITLEDLMLLIIKGGK